MRASVRSITPARLAVVVWPAVLSGLLLWPLHRGGYLLGHDLVFTPQQPLDAASLGISSASPRAVPLDALVALAEKLVDGAVVGRLAVAVPLLGASLGVSWLLRNASLPAILLGSGLALWNPYVIERLAIGQWALLWAYAALPWIVAACRARPSAVVWAARVLTIACASITPTGGLIAMLSALIAVRAMGRGRRETIQVLGLAAVLQLPWIVPSLTSSATSTSDPAAVAAFAARAEHPGAALLTLLGSGGIWDRDVVPASRGGALAWLGLALVVVAWSYGRQWLGRLLGANVVRGLIVAALVGLVVGVAATVPGGAWLVRSAVSHVPGAGLLRDAQKWIAPFVLASALMAGAALDRVLARVRTTVRPDLPAAPWRVVSGLTALCLPLLLLPDAVATVRATVTPVHYPAGWTTVDALVRGDSVAVLPFQSYRVFPWAPGRSSLDPAPRLLHASVIVQDRLAVGGRLLRGEDPTAAAVAAALAGPSGELAAAMARAGVSWVLVERDTPGSLPDLAVLQAVYEAKTLALYRVPGRVRAVTGRSARSYAAVLAGDIVAGLLVVAALSVLAGHGCRRYRQSRARRVSV